MSPEQKASISQRREQRPGKLESYWNEYGWPTISSLVLLRPLNHRSIGHRAAIENGQKVLEIGSGYPFYKLYSHEVGSEGLFVTVDVNENIQRRSKKIGAKIDRLRNRRTNDQFVTANADHLPFPDSTFDTLLAGNFTGKGYAYIEEAFRVLKPGGRLIVSFTELFSIPIISRQTAQKCKENGFSDVKVSLGAPASIIPGVTWNWFTEARKPADTIVFEGPPPKK